MDVKNIDIIVTEYSEGEVVVVPIAPIATEGEGYEHELNADGGYVIYKLGRQVAAQTVKIASGATEAVGNYRVHAASFDSGKFAGVYAGNLAYIYDAGTVAGRTARRLLLPQKEGGMRLDSAAQDAVRGNGARFLTYSAQIRQLVNVARLTGNVLATIECTETSCGLKEKVAIAADTTELAFAIPAWHLRGRGLHSMSLGAEAKAFRLLSVSTKMGVGIGAFRAAAGASRVVIETGHYLNTGDANGSSMIDGTVETMTGGAQMLYARYLLKEAGATASAASRNSILAAKVVSLPAYMTVTLRAAGAVGAGMGLAANMFIVGDALFDGHLSPYQRRKNICSGLMGVTGSSFLIASAFFVAPPLLPVAAALMIAGTLILIGQSVYDHYDEY